jgi:hypothetical protein
MALERPLLRVPPLELPEGLDQISDHGEVPDADHVLVQGPDGTYCDRVVLGLPDKAMMSQSDV